MRTSLHARDLVPLEAYAREHESHRAEILAHRADRMVRLGRNATLLFEDEAMIRFQIQESLRIEGIADPDGVQAEIDRYAGRMPDGSNLKASFMFEFADSATRSAALPKLAGAEARVWVQAPGTPRVFGTVSAAEADSDEASGVHLLRFDLDKATLRVLRGGAPLSMGIDHPGCHASLVVGDATRRALLKDLG